MFSLPALRALAVWLGLALAWVWIAPARAQDVLPVPALTARVIDQTGTLSPEQIQSLSSRLAALEQEKGSQVVILMVPSTAPEDIAAYANRVASQWKLGRKNVGDGALIIVALKERRMRIEVARALEGALPDILVKRIIDQHMVPHFRQGDFAGGLDAAVQAVAARIRGEELVETPEDDDDAIPNSGALLALILFALASRAILRRRFGRNKTAFFAGLFSGAMALLVTDSLIVALIVMYLVWSAYLNGSDGGGKPRSQGFDGFDDSFGGGGFSGGSGYRSGGGGSFGGGGASGSW